MAATADEPEPNQDDGVDWRIVELKASRRNIDCIEIESNRCALTQQQKRQLATLQYDTYKSKEPRIP